MEGEERDVECRTVSGTTRYINTRDKCASGCSGEDRRIDSLHCILVLFFSCLLMRAQKLTKDAG